MLVLPAAPMELLTPDQVTPAPDDVVFRETRLGRTLVALVFLLVGAGWWSAPLLDARGWIPAVLFGVPCVLAALLVLPGIARAWRNPSWVVCVRPDGIAVNVRSHLNGDLPASDRTVAWLAASEIADVRVVRQRQLVPDPRQRTTVTRSHWIELRLRHARTHELAALLESERARRGKGRVHHAAYPVHLAAPDAIRIAFRDAHTRLAPSIARAAAELGARYTVREPLDEGTRDGRAMPDSELDGFVRELCVAGRRLEAIRLVRSRRGWDLAQAKRFVDEIAGARDAA